MEFGGAEGLITTYGGHTQTSMNRVGLSRDTSKQEGNG